MKSILFAICLMLGSTVYANNSFVYTAKITSVDVYNVLNDSSIQGAYSNGSVEESLVGSILGKVINYQGAPTKVTESLAHVSMTGIGKESLVYSDKKEGTNQVIQATVERSFFARSLKGLMISSDQMKAIVAESLKKKGQSLVTNAGMKMGEAMLDYSVDMSDYVCTRKDNIMSCNMDAVIKMSYK